ncbi:DUF1641 domain-containing protein [Alicyclobacillus dauci]|uniref:DUF1641 domain-containing protein n=1 Tax=Alicyclobacillus dauci TaxID=1475485 RepID=A0ABY6YYE7_9BACL|nr:DUF1641 domain-containing protein [Alicyclobacillus dauci]WAH35652.1 DUF1641 domain-containing protein [Alicyclobacillus dauci]
MAQAIHKIVENPITPEQERARSRSYVDDEIIQSSDAIVEVLRLIRQLHEKRLLAIVNALLEQGTDVLEIIVAQAAQPQYAKGFKNALGLVQMLGTMDVGLLSNAMEALSTANKRMEAGEIEPVGGPFKLMGAMRDPDVGAGLGFAFEVLRTLGGQLRQKEHTEASH